MLTLKAPLGPRTRNSLDRRHSQLEVAASPRDRAFLHTIAMVGFSLLLAVGAINWLVDPLAAFGTGLLPPAVGKDRDYKTILYRRLPSPPEIVIIGSSRTKTLPPTCVQRITGHPTFNFGVSGAAAEDYLAIFRWLRLDSLSRVSRVLLGVDPEGLRETAGGHRLLEASRALRGLVSGYAARNPNRADSPGFVRVAKP